MSLQSVRSFGGGDLPDSQGFVIRGSDKGVVAAKNEVIDEVGVTLQKMQRVGTFEIPHGNGFVTASGSNEAGGRHGDATDVGLMFAELSAESVHIGVGGAAIEDDKGREDGVEVMQTSDGVSP